ncbi:MAG: DNA adenine methylase [Firmicutes bacterium]|nr:DNA adenine methylase [Bacillota bacterium]
MSEQRKSPTLKWAGGKSQLLDVLQSKMPKSYNRYFEPFIGGGALFLSVSPQYAVINDTNEQLINLYCQLRSSYMDVIHTIDKLDNIPCDKNFYLSMRTKYNEKILHHELDSECAALMIWVNKHCFNGLYRVNRKGMFNVPYNNKTGGKSIDENNLIAIGKYLQSSDVEILNSDFEVTCSSVRKDDFVYFDSPYVPVSETAYFTDYTMDGFTLNDHKRLSELFKQLDKIGAKIMLSNNDVSLVRSLYKGYNIQSVGVKRMINRDASKRTGQEVIITNY